MRSFLFAVAFALSMSVTAEASVGVRIPPTAVLATTPIAMCGYACRGDARYIPGPPAVCYQHGLEYCGSSRDRPPAAQREFYNPDDFRGRGRVEEHRPRPHNPHHRPR